VGDEGSCYHVGYEDIIAVLKRIDGRGSYISLVLKLFKHIGDIRCEELDQGPLLSFHDQGVHSGVS